MPLAIAPFTELVPVVPDTLFICRSDGASELVMNRAQQWTPLSQFAHPFPAEYARAIAQQLQGAYTRDRIDLGGDAS